MDDSIAEFNASMDGTEPNYDSTWNELMISACEEQLAASTVIEYGEPTDIVIAITIDEGAYYGISDNDMMNIDELIIAY